MCNKCKKSITKNQKMSSIVKSISVYWPIIIHLPVHVTNKKAGTKTKYMKSSIWHKEILSTHLFYKNWKFRVKIYFKECKST